MLLRNCHPSHPKHAIPPTKNRNGSMRCHISPVLSFSHSHMMIVNPPGSSFPIAFWRITLRQPRGCACGALKPSMPRDIQHCMDSSYQKPVRERCHSANVMRAANVATHSNARPNHNPLVAPSLASPCWCISITPSKPKPVRHSCPHVVIETT